MSSTVPPRVAGWLARRLLRAPDAARLLGDLDEEYSDTQLHARGRVAARLWYWRQVVLSIRALRAHPPLGVLPRERSSMETALLDVRFALRQFAARPAYAAATILTFALGIGATTAVFALVHGILLQPLPWDGADRIVRFWAHTDDGDILDFSFRVAEYRALREHDDLFQYVGAEFPASLSLLPDEGEPRQIQARRVSSDLFRVFGVEPALGRMFTAEETAAGDALVVVVSHSLWSRDLGADPEAIGSRIDLGGTRFEVIGVLPEGYRHVSGPDVEAFFPYTLGTSGWIAHWLDLYGRLQPGTTTPLAVERVNATIDAVAETDARSDGWHATGESLHEMTVGEIRPALLAAVTTVALVLLIGCVNVAMLTLARTSARAPELALRSALGARRGRIMRQLVAESLVLSALGGAVGLAIGAAGTRLLLRMAPAGMPRIAEVSLDPMVVGGAAAATLAIGVVLGLATGARLVSATPHDGLLSAGDRATGRRGPFGGLVVLEVAVTIALLVGAVLMVRTLDRLQSESLGFRREGVLSFRVVVPPSRYPSSVETAGFYDALRHRLSSLPGVVRVGAGSDLPVSGEGAVATLRSEERIRAGNTEGVTALQRRATTGFLETLGVPLVAGRFVEDRDTPQAPTVLVLSESLARALFPDGGAVGQRVSWRREPAEDDWMTVVGVVGDVRYQRVDRVEEPQLYQAHPQSAARDMAVVVRTEGDPRQLIGSVRALVAELDSKVPIYGIRTLEGITSDAMGDRRFVALLLSSFAATAVALAVAGIYGVLAMMVGRRRREIGVRIALGAAPVAVVRQVVVRAMVWVGAGTVLGLLGATALARLLEALLYGVAPTDPISFAVAALGLGAISLGASYLPARRAAGLNPVEALRGE